MKVIYHFGKYYLLLQRVFSKPEKNSIYRQQLLKEIDSLGVGSLGIVAIVSVFMGAVITIQSAFGFNNNPLVPLYAIGMATRDSIMLEFSPTIVSLILAGKIGSNIASEIGTMRVTEQIDALEIMGINASSYLILPKITASVIINPFLILISMFLGILGGGLLGTITNVVTSTDYIYGIQYGFKPYNLVYSLIKTAVFAFLITSISSYHGYYTKGGSLEVGQASTKAVVYSSVAILLFNFLLTQLLLA